MKIEFEIDYMDENYNSTLIDENAVQSKLALLRNKLGDGNSQEGFVRITKSGQPIVSIYDAYWFLVKNLCFEYISDNLNNQKDCYNYGYYVMDNYLVLTDSNKTIKILGDDSDVPAAIYPKNEFLPALYHCGKRIIDFLESLGFHEGVLPLLKEAEAKTRKTLSEHGLLLLR